MLGERSAANQILEIVRTHPGCGLDELTQYLPQMNWSQVFIEVDRLSRSGQLRLTKIGSGFLTKLDAV
jgi:hypothetical protein